MIWQQLNLLVAVDLSWLFITIEGLISKALRYGTC